MKLKITEDVAPDFKVGQITDSTTGKPVAVSTAPFTDAQRDELPKKIRVLLEATHTGVNKNLVEYTHDGLAASVDSWTKDFNKPVLLNHDSHSDPLGRVVAAEYKQSIIDNTKNCIQLELEITNAAAIERFLDGRYKTFSIGGYTDSAKCSICGKDQMTDGWCGHSRGRKYGDKVCHWTLGAMDYVEVSVVNCPADNNAQAISFTDDKGAEIPMPGQAAGSEDNHGGEPQKDEAQGILGQIDGLVGITQKDGQGEPGVEPQTDGNEPQTGNDDPQAGNEPQTDGNEPTGNEEPQTDEKDKRIKELEAQVAEKDSLIAEKDAEITTLTGKLATSDQAAAESKRQLDAANLENDGLVKQNVALAKYAHKTMCENFADMQIMAGAKQSDDRESLIKEYSTYTSQKLSDSIKGLISTPHQQRPVPVVPHPGAGQIDEAGIVSDSTTKGDKAPSAIDELNKAADAMQGFLAGRNRHA